MTSFLTNTFFNKKTKDRTRRPIETDVRSKDNNMDMMLGGNNSKSMERKLEIVLNHSLAKVIPTPFLPIKFLHSKLGLKTYAVKLGPLGHIDP